MPGLNAAYRVFIRPTVAYCKGKRLPLAIEFIECIYLEHTQHLSMGQTKSPE